MDHVLVTVVTPSFNQGRYIEQTILSVLEQTYPHIRYIIVDGGSTDQTMEIVDRYRSRIDVVIHEKDDGQGDALNKGFALAGGALAGWINADDRLHPLCVEKIVDLYDRNPEGAIFYSGQIRHIDGSGAPVRTYHRKISGRDDLLLKNYNLIQPSAFFSIAKLREAGAIDSSLRYCMDLDLWLRLLRFGHIYYTEDQPLADFRIWENSKTSTGGIRFLREIRRTLRRHGAPPFCPNVLRTLRYEFKCRVKNLMGR